MTFYTVLSIENAQHKHELRSNCSEISRDQRDRRQKPNRTRIRFSLTHRNQSMC